MTTPPTPPPANTTWHKIALLAQGVLAVVAVLGLVSDDLSGGTTGVARLVAVVAAAAFAVVFYVRWSSRREHSVADHAGTAMALIGGAFFVAAAFAKADDSEVFGNPVLVVAGLVFTSLAVLAGQWSIFEDEKGRA